MEVKKTIVMTEKEYIDLCAFLGWTVRNPNICNNCPHFATWEKTACCGCPEQSEYVKTYKSMSGYETSKNEELKEFCEAYKAHVKASMRFQAARRDYAQGGITMNIIKNGDPRKIEEHNRRRAFRVFTCPICGCVWEASIAPGTTEARPGSHLSEMDGYDGWYSDCPMTNCPGVGTESKE